MNKLEKPKFFTIPIWGNVSMILGFIVCFAFSKYISDFWLLIITVCLVFTFILWNLIKYIINWHKLYKEYLNYYKQHIDLQQRHIALSKQFDKKAKLVNKQNELISQYKYTLFELYGDISRGILPVNKYEKEYLKNLADTTLRNIEHLNKTEGDIENGRNL